MVRTDSRRTVCAVVLSVACLCLLLFTIRAHARPAQAPAGNTSLLPFCAAQGITWQWEPVSRVATLHKAGKEIRLRVGERCIYMGTERVPITHILRLEKGAVIMPPSVSAMITSFFGAPTGTAALSSGQQAPAAEPFQCHLVRTIVLDAGHGGKDPGAIGRRGLKEKDVTLDIVTRMKKRLEGAGVKVILTRDSDVFVPLWKRAEIANNANADFFISVHANSARARWAKGFEAYYLAEKPTDDEARALEVAENSVLRFEENSFAYHSKNLDAIVADILFDQNRLQSRELASYICQGVPRPMHMENRGVKGARFYVLKYATMTSVLVETAFISNAGEEAKLSTRPFREGVADALTEAVLKYKRQYEVTNGFSR